MVQEKTNPNMLPGHSGFRGIIMRAAHPLPAVSPPINSKEPLQATVYQTCSAAERNELKFVGIWSTLRFGRCKTCATGT